MSQIILLVILAFYTVFAQSPHGLNLKTDCADCHKSTTWKELSEIRKFDHNSTAFALMGQHASVDCKQCHATLKFEEAHNNCLSCHKDIHAGTVGKDCQQCHTPNTWLVSDTKKLHETTRFPLLGKHQDADCAQCHTSYGSLHFEALNIDCYTCHRSDYDKALNPNHRTGGFTTDCIECHTIDARNWKAGNFSHEFFPLQGGHNLQDCFSCHVNNQFTGLDANCVACHLDDYNTVTNPDHVAADFGTDCKVCHSIASWKPADFNHDLTLFTLTGKHITTDCQSCHTAGYTNTPANCNACHNDNYIATTNPNHRTAGIPIECEQCHTTSGWSPATFDHNLTNFPLSGKHTTVQCQACHTTGYVNTPVDCNGCHNDNYAATTNPNHVTAGFPVQCGDCHTTNGWTPAQFDHDNLYFPIYSGKHRNEWNNCNECHTTAGNYALFSCISCHEHNNRQSVDNDHNGVSGYVYESTACLSCHPDGRGDGAFDHGTSDFPLTGAHTSTVCSDCHTDGFSPPLSPSCAQCHVTTVQNVTNPNHTSAGFTGECTECHNTSVWKPSTFDHTTTGFTILGAHVGKDCNSCHQSGYATTQSTCVPCHQSDVNSTLNPNHQSAGFSALCETCHSNTAWTPSSFDHSTTGFTLIGAHVGKDCNSCHQTGYSTTQSTCVPCHQSDVNNTLNPNHQSAGFSTLCETCHTSSAWTPTSFDHTTTGFELAGAHAGRDCNSCHAAGYTNTQAACISCHLDDYTTTTNPNHQAANFPQECAPCHSVVAWTPASFDHDAQYFPINSGEHDNEWNACADCHTNASNFAVFACITCHEHSNQQEVNNQHQGVSGYIYASSECFACHPDGTSDGAFNHAISNFPLTGAHTTLTCNQCHAAGYANTASECQACHGASYTNAQNPNHQSAGIPQTCSTCHTATAWIPSTFNHGTTVFALTGAHVNQQCSSCHTGSLTTASSDCQSCHQQDFTATTNPDHELLTLSSACADCHTTNAGWVPATFAVHNTYFPLLGRHAQIQNNCNSCHNGNYNSTPNTCYGCHLTDYNTATNPNHISAAFPHECESCHTQSVWEPSTFNHDSQYFPIYSGQHRNEWNTCSQCHENASNFAIFTCISCHEHNQASMNQEHQGVNNYQYVSTACLNCHPDGDSKLKEPNLKRSQ